MFIECGICNSKFILFLLPPIFNMINSIFSDGTFSVLYETFLEYIGFLLGGLIYLIIACRSKRKEKKDDFLGLAENCAVNQIKKEVKEKKERIFEKERIYIFLLSLLYFISDTLNIFLSNKVGIIDSTNSQKNISIVLTFYCYFLFSKLILRDKIERHRIVSIIIITFCFSVLFIFDGGFDDNLRSFLIVFLYVFATIGTNALFAVLIKIHFNNFLTDPYLFTFYIGLFILIILIIFEVIYNIFFNGCTELLGRGIISQISQIIANSNDLVTNLINSVALIIINFVVCGSEIIIVYHFTPCHFIIPLMIQTAILEILVWLLYGGFGILSLIILIAANVIMVIFTLVYNEVLILKVCSLHKQTSKYITLRQKDEYIKMSNSIMKDDESNKDSEYE